MRMHEKYFFDIFDRTTCYPPVPKLHKGFIGPVDNSRPKLTWWEVKKVIARLRRGKSSGRDGLKAEMLQLLDKEHLDIVIEFIILVWDSGGIQENWIESLISVLPKQGKDLGLVASWRPVALLSITSKVISTVVLNRIAGHANNFVLSDDQNGFRSYRRGADHVLLIRILSSLHLAKKVPLYIYFLDISQAFDSVIRDFLYDALVYFGFPDKEIEIIQQLYTNHTFSVKREGQASGSRIPTKGGLKQGCPLSPTLFSTCLEYILRITPLAEVVKLKRALIPQAAEGDVVADAEYRELAVLLCADDICGFCNNLDKVQENLSVIDEFFKKFNLIIPAGKTKYVKVGRPAEEPFVELNLPQGKIEQVTEFVYLGSVISEDGSSLPDIKNRIQKTCGNMVSFRKYFGSKRVARWRKVHVLQAFFLPVVTYCSETWTLTAQAKNELDTFWNKQHRKCYGVTKRDRIEMDTIRKELNVTKLSDYIEERRWNYYGHVSRYPDSRPANFILRAGLDNQRAGRFATWKKQIDSNKAEASMFYEDYNDNLVRDKKKWAEVFKAVTKGRALLEETSSSEPSVSSVHP